MDFTTLWKFAEDNKHLILGGSLLLAAAGAATLSRAPAVSSYNTPKQPHMTPRKTSPSTSRSAEQQVCDIECCGFDRPKSGSCSATVPEYTRHLFICTGRSDWPAHITSDEKYGFVETLSEALKAAKIELKSSPVKITLCDEPTVGSGTDILLFPKGMKYKNLTKEDIPRLLDDLKKDALVNGLDAETLCQQFVFVCCHKNRDMRCGTCGPILVEDFRSGLLSRKVRNQDITVSKCSHVGGHKYAGNVLLFGSGDWFGYVCPTHVNSLLEYSIYMSSHDATATINYIGSNEVLKGLWRGRMGMTTSDQIHYAESWGVKVKQENKQ